MSERDWHWWLHLHLHPTRPFLRDPPQEWWRYSSQLGTISTFALASFIALPLYISPYLFLREGLSVALVYTLITALLNAAHMVLHYRENKELYARKFRERMGVECPAS